MSNPERRPPTLLDARGALTLPLLLFLLIGLGTGLGILFLLERWRVQARIQLQLDLCVAQRAEQLQSTARQIESLNEKLVEIRHLREVLGWVPGAPAISEPIAEAAVDAITIPQEALRIRWASLLLKACEQPFGWNSTHVRPRIRPDLWLRSPERDRWGPGPLELTHSLRRERTQELTIHAQFRNRRSAALLEFEPKAGSEAPRIGWASTDFDWSDWISR